MDQLTKRERVWLESWGDAYGCHHRDPAEGTRAASSRDVADVCLAYFDERFPPPAEPDARDCDPQPLTFTAAIEQGIVPTCGTCMFAKQPKTPGPLHGIADGCVDCMHAGGPPDGMHHAQGCCSNWVQRLPSQPSPLDATDEPEGGGP